MEIPKSTEPVVIKFDLSHFFALEPAVELPFLTFIRAFPPTLGSVTPFERGTLFIQHCPAVLKMATAQ
ncbi:hypothetical protein Peur_056434 [Populus x canadensis]